jgi:hypothetical protein
MFRPCIYMCVIYIHTHIHIQGRNMQQFYKNMIYCFYNKTGVGLYSSRYWLFHYLSSRERTNSSQSKATQIKRLITVWASDGVGVWCLLRRHHSTVLRNLSLTTIMHLHLQLAADVVGTSSTTLQQQGHSPANNKTTTTCHSSSFLYFIPIVSQSLLLADPLLASKITKDPHILAM